MGLTMAERKSVTRELAQKYRRGSRRKKGIILDQLMQLNGWTRHHAAWVLRCWGRTVLIWRDVRAQRGERRPRGSCVVVLLRPTARHHDLQ